MVNICPTQPHSGRAPSGTLRGVHPGSVRRGGASRTAGTLRVFKQFAWLEVGSSKMAWSRPTHQYPAGA
ncbi:MAG TPA: hypothetical protein VK206_14985 [Anaerolineales bacterium]|nr:hypothetical protein [Anaerolineales bacterium]